MAVLRGTSLAPPRCVPRGAVPSYLPTSSSPFPAARPYLTVVPICICPMSNDAFYRAEISNILCNKFLFLLVVWVLSVSL